MADGGVGSIIDPAVPIAGLVMSVALYGDGEELVAGRARRVADATEELARVESAIDRLLATADHHPHDAIFVAPQDHAVRRLNLSRPEDAWHFDTAAAILKRAELLFKIEDLSGGADDRAAVVMPALQGCRDAVLAAITPGMPAPPSTDNAARIKAIGLELEFLDPVTLKTSGLNDELARRQQAAHDAATAARAARKAAAESLATHAAAGDLPAILDLARRIKAVGRPDLASLPATLLKAGGTLAPLAAVARVMAQDSPAAVK